MPGMGGQEVARALRGQAKLVLCSGDAVEDYKAMGFDYCIAKPIEMDKLKDLCFREGCTMRREA